MPRLASTTGRSGHLDEHPPILLQPLLEQRPQLLLERHELLEDLTTFGEDLAS